MDNHVVIMKMENVQTSSKSDAGGMIDCDSTCPGLRCSEESRTVGYCFDTRPSYSSVSALCVVNCCRSDLDEPSDL